jgi:hypothetical protein
VSRQRAAWAAAFHLPMMLLANFLAVPFEVCTTVVLLDSLESCNCCHERGVGGGEGPAATRLQHTGSELIYFAVVAVWAWLSLAFSL